MNILRPTFDELLILPMLLLLLLLLLLWMSILRHISLNIGQRPQKTCTAKTMLNNSFDELKVLRENLAILQRVANTLQQVETLRVKPEMKTQLIALKYAENCYSSFILLLFSMLSIRTEQLSY